MAIVYTEFTREEIDEAIEEAVLKVKGGTERDGMRAALETIVTRPHLLLNDVAARHNIDYRKVSKYRNRFNKILSEMREQQQRGSGDSRHGDDAQPARESEHHYGDYESEILGYFKRRQALFRPDNYFSRLNMSEDKRSELVNIMAAIAFCNQMSTDAFLLAVRLCDIFMTKTTEAMTKIKAHKLSVAAINIGSKFDDRYSPSLESTFTKIWRTKLEKFTQLELYEMEFELLETLGHDTYAPSANHFLVHFFKKGHENRTEDKPTLVLAKYYLETAMFSLELCQLKIEKIAAACLMAATMKLEEGRNYVESYATHTGYGFAELNEIVNKLFSVSNKSKEEKTRLWNYYTQGNVPGFGDIMGLL